MKRQIDAARGGGRDAAPIGEFPLRKETFAGLQPAGFDVGGELVGDDLIARQPHGAAGRPPI